MHVGGDVAGDHLRSIDLMLRNPLTPKDERESAEEAITRALAEVWGDGEAYAELVFPWGEKGTALEKWRLKKWQRSYLRQLGKDMRDRGFDGQTPVDPIMDSTVSGHGIGKSALTAIVVKFIHDTCAHSKGVVTANTATQLKTRTWAEVGKWHRLSVTSRRSSYFASRGNMSLVNQWYPETWRVDAYTATKEMSESFQGVHAAGSVPFMVFDEASAIPESIFQASMGAMTDGLPIWLLFGNGTRASGQFYESHNSRRTLWRHRGIDSREVEGANLNLFQRWIDTYGIDSDFVRVRVRGMFPNASSLQFIATDVVEWCMNEYMYKYHLTDPLIYGVDVARFGDDESVLCKRRGRKVIPITHRYTKLDPVDFAPIIANEAKADDPDAIFVDGDGVGGPLVTLLRRMNVSNVIEFSGAKAKGIPTKECANWRAFAWSNLRDALKLGVDLPLDDDLKRDLTALEYGYRITDNKLLLERKEDAKRRGVASPDLGDALAMTYALPVARRGASKREGGAASSRPSNLVTDH